MTERVGMEITVDAKQANAEINKTATSARTLSGTLEKLDRVSLTAAKGIGALGPALGAASRSSSELLRGIGDVAGLLGSGGVFGVAVGVAALGVAKLSEKWMESGKAAAKATEEAVRAARSIADAIEQSITDMELAATKAETGIQDTAEARARMMRVELSGLNLEIKELEKTAPRGVVSKFFSDSDNKLEDAKNKAAALKVELEKIDALLSDRKSVGLRTPKTAKPPAGGRGGGRAIPNEPEVAAIGYGDDGPLPDAAFVYNGPSPEALAVLEEARTDVVKAETASRLRIAEDFHKEMLRQAEEQAEAEKRAREEVRQAYESMYAAGANGGVQQMVGAAQDYMYRSIEAQGAAERAALGDSMAARLAAEEVKKQAFEASAAAFMRSTGDQLVSVGTKAMIEGGIISLNPATPGAGIPMAVAGAAAIGVGLSMGAQGAKMQQAQQTAVLKAEMRGAKLDEQRKARDGGVGTGRGGRGRSGGGGRDDREPVQIVNVWGVDGPQAEDQARRTVRSNRLARRRGFA